MDAMPLPPAIGVFVTLMTAVQLAWYVGVAVLLFKIWGRVKHLPS